jgi:hypothetical protein
MSRRSITTATAGLVLAAVLGGLGAAPAHAADRCSVAAALPELVAINAAQMEVPVGFGDPAACNSSASYVVRKSGQGRVAAVQFGAGDNRKTFVLDRSSGPGDYTAVGRNGVDLSGKAERMYKSDPMLVKFDSRFTLHGAREGGVATFRVDLERWSYDANGYTTWKGARVYLQKKVHGEWVVQKVAKSRANGEATFALTSKKGKWRAFVEDSASVWGGQTYGITL